MTNNISGEPKISCLIFQAAEGKDDCAFPFLGKRAIVDISLNELVNFRPDFGIWVIPEGEKEAICTLKKNLQDFKFVYQYLSIHS